MEQTQCVAQKVKRCRYGQHLPDINLRVAVQIVYYDGQFDDARLNVSLACTAALAGAAIVNYAEVTELLKVRSLWLTSSPLLYEQCLLRNVKCRSRNRAAYTHTVWDMHTENRRSCCESMCH